MVQESGLALSLARIAVAKSVKGNREVTVHNLKVHTQFWPSLESGEKPFEVRRDDRRYRVGDICALREYNPSWGFTGKGPIERKITYILTNEDFPIGVPPGFVVLGFGKEACDHIYELTPMRVGSCVIYRCSKCNEEYEMDVS